MPSLLELTARWHVRHGLYAANDAVPASIRALLGQARQCTTCGGPFFAFCVRRGRFLEMCDRTFPVVYSLCVAHWNDDAGRIVHVRCARRARPRKRGRSLGRADARARADVPRAAQDSASHGARQRVAAVAGRGAVAVCAEQRGAAEPARGGGLAGAPPARNVGADRHGAPACRRCAEPGDDRERRGRGLGRHHGRAELAARSEFAAELDSGRAAQVRDPCTLLASRLSARPPHSWLACVRAPAQHRAGRGAPAARHAAQQPQRRQCSAAQPAGRGILGRRQLRAGVASLARRRPRRARRRLRGRLGVERARPRGDHGHAEPAAEPQQRPAEPAPQPARAAFAACRLAFVSPRH